MGIGPVFFVMIAEMFPPSVSNVASCLTMTVLWIANLIVVTVYSPLSNWIGDSRVFIITFVFSFALVLFTVFVVKETKGIHTNKNGELEKNDKKEEQSNIV
ncbi:MAG: hypothetical protein EZS28_020926 [Streblomastix strix]|uniref:Major facilitator superfamily (MFS) profile domain-containing protein n=1 Tax=Streblomastix strix TaxID=222440 RepID=A0A5J4VM75_9EUKA|nr:MAG: hypothetical protein EZS28_020926 [Streblomastix strix]